MAASVFEQGARMAWDPADCVVTTTDLKKTYRTRRGRQVAVDSLNFQVPAGGVHGFLGPNGSGKTTTIRMLLGLIRPDSGTMSLYGKTVPKHLPEVIGKIGAIVENPKFQPNFSARQNLQLLAAGIGADRKIVDQVLEEVGLSERADDRFREFSLGMKQRLAVAATMLKEPDLLIFDEPTNGLDPAGIREIRDTMRGLGELGKTVLVSSHILAEVEQVADTVSIIGRGRLLASGTVSDVIGTKLAMVTHVGVENRDVARRILTQAGLTVRRDGDGLAVEGEPDGAKITKILADAGHYVHELTPVRAGLEAVFLELTAGEGPGTSTRHLLKADSDSRSPEHEGEGA